MPHPIPSRSALALLAAWIVPAAGFALVAASVWSYARTGEAEAGGGSPYYDSAVKQAITGLRNVGAADDAPAQRPPLPAGLNPDEHYWCEQCKTYHKREAGQPAAQPAAQPVGQPVDPFAPPFLLQRPAEVAPAAQPALQPIDFLAPPPLLQRPLEPGGAPASGIVPPLPQGLNPADYYWDAPSNSYRLRRSGGG